MIRINVFVLASLLLVSYSNIYCGNLSDTEIHAMFKKINSEHFYKNDPPIGKYIEDNIDLNKREIGNLMIQSMNNSFRYSRETVLKNYLESDYIIDGANTMGIINREHPAKGILWLIENFDRLNANGRAAMIHSLNRVKNYKETYDIVFLFIEDKTYINSEMSGEIPPQYRAFYANLRICDKSYRVLTHLLVSGDKLPDILKKGIFGHTIIEDRDICIDNMKKWWKDNSSGITAEMSSLSEKEPTIKEKIKELESKIKKVEKKKQEELEKFEELYTKCKNFKKEGKNNEAYNCVKEIAGIGENVFPYIVDKVENNDRELIPIMFEVSKILGYYKVKVSIKGDKRVPLGERIEGSNTDEEKIKILIDWWKQRRNIFSILEEKRINSRKD